MAGDQVFLLDLPDEIEDLLSAAHGKGGDDHVAAPVQHLLDARGQFLYIVHPLLAVEAVAVGGLDDQIFRVLHRLGVPQDGLVGVAHIAAEGDLPRLAALVEPDLDGGGAQQMAHVRQADGDAVVDLDQLPIAAGAQQSDGAQGVFHVVEGLHGLAAVALGLAAFPLGLRDLDVGAVTQHDIAEGAGGRAGIDRAAIAVFVQQGQLAAVVDMGVGQEDKVQPGWFNGQILIDEEILALLHAVVHDTLFIAHFNVGAAAGHLMGRAQECHVHALFPPFPFFLVLFYTSFPRCAIGFWKS